MSRGTGQSDGGGGAANGAATLASGEWGPGAGAAEAINYD
jgi:hypothetical protein